MIQSAIRNPQSTIVAVTLTATLLMGCAGRRPQAPPIYTGPTEPMAAVVERINANAVKLPVIWSRIASFDAWIRDENGKTHFVNGNGGNLLFRQPHDLLLRGRKDIAGTVFDIGANAERYWMIAPNPGPDRMWWGYWRNVGRPCAASMPLSPDLFVQVLGAGAIDVDFLSEPHPVMRFNNDADAYMFVFHARASGPPRWIATREIWYDRATLRPVRVLLFDAHGRVLLRALLSEHRPVQTAGLPAAQWPTLASRYNLYFPDSGSKITLLLEDLAVGRKGLPNDASFRFPEQPGVSEIIQIDRDCEK